MAKDSANEKKWQPTRMGIFFFTNYTSNEGLIYKIHKELKKKTRYKGKK